MLSMAFSQMIYAIVFKWYGLTGGSDGIAGIPRSTLWFGIGSLTPRIAYYYFVLTVIVLSVFVFTRIIKSPFGKWKAWE